MMTASDQHPFIDAGIADLRPYAITQGRTTPTHELDLITLVGARSSAHSPPQGLVEEAVFLLCRSEARSIGELSGRLRQPVHAVKVVVSDLIDQGFLIPSMAGEDEDARDPNVLGTILAGLREL